MLNAQKCPESLATVVSVSKCPRNKLEWKGRASLKKCSTNRHTCEESKDELQYHCVLNENATELIEVCAIPKPIHGKIF